MKTKATLTTHNLLDGTPYWEIQGLRYGGGVNFESAEQLFLSGLKTDMMISEYLRVLLQNG